MVANAFVGLGAPLIDTVGALESGLEELASWVDEAERIVKRGEVLCITPCVELMNMRK